MRVRAFAECVAKAARRLGEGVGAGSDAGCIAGLTNEDVFFPLIMKENMLSACVLSRKLNQGKVEASRCKPA